VNLDKLFNFYYLLLSDKGQKKFVVWKMRRYLAELESRDIFVEQIFYECIDAKEEHWFKKKKNITYLKNVYSIAGKTWDIKKKDKTLGIVEVITFNVVKEFVHPEFKSNKWLENLSYFNRPEENLPKVLEIFNEELKDKKF